jgi:hypothetical protein
MEVRSRVGRDLGDEPPCWVWPLACHGRYWALGRPGGRAALWLCPACLSVYVCLTTERSALVKEEENGCRSRCWRCAQEGGSLQEIIHRDYFRAPPLLAAFFPAFYYIPPLARARARAPPGGGKSPEGRSKSEELGTCFRGVRDGAYKNTPKARRRQNLYVERGSSKHGSTNLCPIQNLPQQQLGEAGDVFLG